jgi:hypothetical protein
VPVQRFRDLDEARRSLWTGSDDPGLAERIRRLWRFSTRLAKPCAPRGILRFRTNDDDRIANVVRRASTGQASHLAFDRTDATPVAKWPRFDATAG